MTFLASHPFAEVTTKLPKQNGKHVEVLGRLEIVPTKESSEVDWLEMEIVHCVQHFKLEGLMAGPAGRLVGLLAAPGHVRLKYPIIWAAKCGRKEPVIDRIHFTTREERTAEVVAWA